MDAQRATLCPEREAVAAEKEVENAKMSQQTPGSIDDLIELNVGGEHITTKRSTLTSVEGSMLAAMFGGRWEDKLTLDKEGWVFLDLSPYAVRKVIDQLRLNSIAKDTSAVSISPDMRTEYDAVLEYFGLTIGLPVFSAATTEHALRPSDLSNRGNIQNGPRPLNKAVVGAVQIPVGGCWKVRINNDCTVCSLGILGKDANPASEDQLHEPTRYSWGNSGQLCVAGKCMHGCEGFPGIENDTPYYFQLREAELIMLKEPQEGARLVYRMPVAPDIAYRIHVIVDGPYQGYPRSWISPIDEAEAKQVGLARLWI